MVRALFLILIVGTRALHAAPELCERAAQVAARETGVPEDVLRAITLAETGRSRGGAVRPWPWSANIGGQGHWLESEAALRALIDAAMAAGQRQIDIGCFQINWHWHRGAFGHPHELVDPLTGARYAARYLTALISELGDLEAAIGAYHSRDPARAARYGARVEGFRAAGPRSGVTAPDSRRVRPLAGSTGERPVAPGAIGALSGSLVHPAARLRPFISGFVP